MKTRVSTISYDLSWRRPETIKTIVDQMLAAVHIKGQADGYAPRSNVPTDNSDAEMWHLLC